jgi:hypothetical protein
MDGEAGVTVIVGRERFVSTTSSVDVHVPFVVVQRSVALVPAGIPDTVVVAEDALDIVAVPLTTVQAPEPVLGTVAAIVKVPLLQFA